MESTDEGLKVYILSVIRERGAGSDKSISADNLASKASTYFEKSITGREIRQAVHDLRIAGRPVCSGATGFYWPASLQDCLICADMEFRSEARQMLRVARSLRQSGRDLFGGQLGMFQ